MDPKGPLPADAGTKEPTATSFSDGNGVPVPPQGPEAPPPTGSLSETRVKMWHYGLGLSSLIPFLGLPSALFSLVLGLQLIRQKGWRLIVLAFCGLAMTGWYGRALFGGGQGANAFDAGHIRSIQRNLYKLVSEIEDFRSKTGRLPGNLQELSQTSSTNLVDLPTDASHEARLFYYLVLPDGRNYHLFSRGPDGEAFTADDILPVLTNDEKVQWGYRVRPSDFSTLQSASIPTVGSDDTTQALDVLRWRDPEDGFAEAKRTRKPLLLDFTAEWCGWCRKLETDVLSKPEVARYINRHFVPVKVMDRMNEERKNTAFVTELQAKFSVRGFPTLAATSVDFQLTSVQRGYIGDPKRMLSFLSQSLER